MTKNQTGYFEKIIKILRELKEDHPQVEVSKHYCLATSEHGGFPTDKELFLALQKHQSELNINTLSDKDFDKVIEDTNDLFSEVEADDEDPEEELYED